MEQRARLPVDWDEHPLRALLFAPGNHPRKRARQKPRLYEAPDAEAASRA